MLSVLSDRVQRLRRCALSLASDELFRRLTLPLTSFWAGLAGKFAGGGGGGGGGPPAIPGIGGGGGGGGGAAMLAP